MMETFLILLVMIVLLLLEGFFSGAEIAIVNANKFRLREQARQGKVGAELVLRMFEKPKRLLTATLVGTNICMVSFTTLGTITLIRFFGEIGGVLAVFLLSPLVLVFGEVVPKSVYQQKADVLAPIVIYPLRWVSWLLHPVILFFAGMASLVSALVGRKKPASLFVAREQMRLLLDSASQVESGTVLDRNRIKQALGFSSTTASEAMIPIAEIISLESDRSTLDLVKLVRSQGFNRVPVFETDARRIVGVVMLTTWDLLDPQIGSRPLQELVRPAQYVAANEPLEDVLDLLHIREDRMAIVVDEFGSAVGMITMEDVVEQVVGEIEDIDFRIHQQRISNAVKVGDGIYDVDALMSVADLNEMLGLSLGTREFHTASGLMTASLKRIPQEGDEVEAYNYRFMVTESNERSHRRIRIERLLCTNE